VLTPRTAVPEGSLIGIPGRFAVLSVSFQLVKRVKCSISTSAHKNLLRINDWFPVSGSNQGSNNLTLKGWPLTVSFIHAFYYSSSHSLISKEVSIDCCFLS
jgi:hypothetical protein